MTNHGVQATKGHLASNGGLRGHSVGASFPFIVFASGCFDEITWNVRAPSGELVGTGYKSASEAEEVAISFKMNS